VIGTIHPPKDSLMVQFTLLLMRFVLYAGVSFISNHSQDNKAVSTNIERLARGSRALFIWTDCDREGEYIGSEVRQEALKGNGRLEIKRARFSNIERA